MSDALVVARRDDQGELKFVPYRQEPRGGGFVNMPLLFDDCGRSRGLSSFEAAEAVVERYMSPPPAVQGEQRIWSFLSGGWTILDPRKIGTGEYSGTR